MDTDILTKFRLRWTKFFSEHEAQKLEIRKLESDLPENAQFMHAACDFWESLPVASNPSDSEHAGERLGNNAEPAQPEDCDVDLIEEDQCGCDLIEAETPSSHARYFVCDLHKDSNL